jgi:O-antigen ligase
MVSSYSRDESIPPDNARAKAARLLRAAMEAMVLAAVCLSPWVFGGADARLEAVLYAGVAGMLVLWAVRTLLEKQFTWQTCPVALCLALMFLLAAAQTIPLGESLLAGISPETSRTYERLLPARPEVLPASGAAESARPAAGSTLSLYPGETRRELVRLLVVFLLFAVVRNNISPEQGLRRLSAALLINAAVMSLFGFVQFFSSPQHVVFWEFETRGQVFGPFVNRNHFAFHTNLAIGLGVGLLLSRSLSLRPSARVPGAGRPRRGVAQGPLSILQDPAALWISLALGVILAAVVFCLSRGGFVALGAGAVVCGVFWWTRTGRSRRAGAIVLTMAVAVGLLGWFGYERIAARLGTLWTGEAFQDDRMALLVRGWSVVRDYPVWGTGFGTFRFIEPLYLHDPGDVGWVYAHAHNEYLEAVIEGGVLRLGLTLLVIAFVFRQACRAVRQHRGVSEEGLALGGLFALSTAAVHSFFEFGVHLPAIAVLLVVVAAQISSLGAMPRRVRGDAEQEQGRAAASRLWCAAPLVATLTAVLLGFVLVRSGQSAAAAAAHRASAELLSTSTEAAAIERQIAHLRAAARLRPADAELQVALGEARLDLAEAGSGSAGRPPESVPSASSHVVSALRHFVHARDLCPLLPLPHVRIAAHVETFDRADPRSAYLARAKLVAPADPQLWYVCGAYELSEQRFEDAWTNWRRSLELSDRFLNRILEQASAHLGPHELMEEVLPARPRLLLAAAGHEHALNDAVQQGTAREAYLRKALALLPRHTRLSAEDWALKAEIHSGLGESGEAVRAWKTALAEQPQQTAWRYAFARHLY